MVNFDGQKKIKKMLGGRHEDWGQNIYDSLLTTKQCLLKYGTCIKSMHCVFISVFRGYDLQRVQSNVLRKRSMMRGK